MIELVDVSYSYNSRRLLNDVNIVINEHDFLGITGPNGCGKTTLVKLLLGLLKPESGKVIYSSKGAIVQHLAMGYLPQSALFDRLFPATVRDVVAMGLLDKDSVYTPFLDRQQRFLVDEAMERTGVLSLANSSIGTLSGGELQRTLLARAVVSSPEVIILDEPNSFLDNRSENEMYELLKGLNNNCAVIVVGHNIATMLRYVNSVACVDGSVTCHSAGEIMDSVLLNKMPML